MPNWDEIQTEWETTEITFKALAEKHGVKEGTLKSRRSREGWSRDATDAKDATAKSERVATDAKGTSADDKKKTSSNGKRKKQSNRSGNPNPSNQFTKRNRAAVTHGFFSKYIPAETLEIMDSLIERHPADLIWDQIQIQYAAIIRAQQIMFVEDQYDMTKEVKKEATADGLESTEWEIQFAWDKHATFLNAQSRAMSELRSLIKQFNDLAFEDDERRLKLEQMALNIDKTKAEVENLTNGNNNNGGDDWVTALKEVAERRRQKQQVTADDN